MIIITSWTGRTGNNILQLIRAIHYAIINNHNLIQFQQHRMLNSKTIILNTLKIYNNSQIMDNFFYLKKFNIVDPEPYIMRMYFQNYIKPIFNIPIENRVVPDIETLYIHFRGGDIFSSNPHSSYVQPPYSYYKDIMINYDSTKLVCEDKTNPCIHELLKQNNVEYISNTLEKDLKILSNISNLVIGFGTFGFLLYLMNPYLKNLYIPDFFVNELPQGNWGNDIKVHVIHLPNYIKVGDWKNSLEQREFMLKYI